MNLMNTHDVIQMGMTKTRSKASRAHSQRPDRYSNQRLLNMINLVGIMAMMVAVPIAGAQSVAPSSLPQVDFSKMGTVALGGSFTGIDFFDSDGSNEGRFSTSADSLVLRGANGKNKVIGSTEDGGIIEAMCHDKSGQGSVYVGGKFATIGGVDVDNGLAKYSIQDQAFSKVGDKRFSSGSVKTLYCSQGQESQVWIGGNFSTTEWNGKGNVLVYHPSNNSLSAPPFSGLDGPVEVITPSDTSDALFFGGSFYTTFTNVNVTNTTSSLNDSLSTLPAPGAPSGTISTGFSRYLTPISLANASIDAGPSSSRSGYSDPKNIICPSGKDGEAGSTYEGRDGSAVKYTVNLWSRIWSSGLRLGNAFAGDKHTAGFR